MSESEEKTNPFAWSSAPNKRWWEDREDMLKEIERLRRENAMLKNIKNGE